MNPRFDLSAYDIDLIIQALARSYKQTGDLILRLQGEVQESRNPVDEEKPSLRGVE